MKNFEEIMSERKNRIEARKDELIRRSLLSEEFLEMIQKNKRPFDLLMSYYQCAVMEIETKFRVLNQEYSLEYDKNPIEGIKTRIKSYDSIVRKIRRKNIPMSLTAIEENIKDIAGVRVICSFPEDIYELADSFLRQDDIVLIEKKDYIKNPKPSGYRSLHLIVQVPIFLQKNKKMVNVEVQFRTIAMDFWQVWNISFAIKKISRQIRHSNCRRSFWRVPPRVLSWITGCRKFVSNWSAELIRESILRKFLISGTSSIIFHKFFYMAGISLADPAMFFCLQYSYSGRRYENRLCHGRNPFRFHQSRQIPSHWLPGG